jgi:hypothetical protein
MLKQGYTPTEIWDKTGQFRGADNIWRYEIPDNEAKLLHVDDAVNMNAGRPDLPEVYTSSLRDKLQGSIYDNIPRINEINNKLTTATGTEKYNLVAERMNLEKDGVKLSDILDHPKLYEAYPQLKDITVDSNVPNDGTLGVARSDGSIGLKADMPPDQMRAVLLHEIQHQIQNIEGTAKGGSPQEFALTPDKIKELQVNHSALADAIAAKVMQIKGMPLKDAFTLLEAQRGKNYNAKLTEPLAKAEMPKLLKMHKKYSEMLNDPSGYQQYFKLAGEAEARNAGYRSVMTTQQLKANPPFEEDVPRERQKIKGVKLTPVGSDPFLYQKSEVAAPKDTATQKGFPLFASGIPLTPVDHHPFVNNSNNVPYGAGASNTPSGYPVNIDKSIPQYDERLKDKTGKPADLWKYLTIHEIEEHKAMEAGTPYLKAHHNIATPAEKAAVEADGVNWKEYEHVLNGYLKGTEHEKIENIAPNLYTKPYPHNRQHLLEQHESR